MGALRLMDVVVLARFQPALGTHGWIGMTWPRRYGGGDRSERERLTVIEELLVAGAPVAAHWFADRQVGPAILRHGTEEQRQRFLPAIATGASYFAIGMSEPDSGSDLASVRTAAVRTGNGWLLEGRKVWTSHAHQAHYLLALVRTSPKNPEDRHQGLSQVVVDLSSPGVTVRPITSLDEGHHFNEVILDGVEVPDSSMLGPAGSGWAQVTSELAYERSGPERFMSNAPLLLALMRRPDLGGHPDVGRLVAELQTLRQLCRKVADAIARGSAPAVDAALVKDLGTRFERKVVDTARRLVPEEPDADSDDPMRRLMAEAVLHGPDATLRGGTSQILRGIVARMLVSD